MTRHRLSEATADAREDARMVQLYANRVCFVCKCAGGHEPNCPENDEDEEEFGDES